MAYFLKKTNKKLKGKDDVYLQIYESYRNKEKKQSCHRAIRVLGYSSRLAESGIKDPIEYGQSIVDEMNLEFKKQKEDKKVKKIGTCPIKNIGSFLLNAVMNTLDIDKYIGYLDYNKKFQFELMDVIKALVYAQVVNPSSKRKAYEDVIPYLYSEYKFSGDQMYDAVEFLGCNYEKVIEIINNNYAQKYTRTTDKVYFDCTNYYFEIDREDDLRRKGPSKENRKEPIIGMGLLLDSNQIPLGMKMYPGNESEKPVMRSIISEMKERHNVTGRTIQVADKGLNCGENIAEAIRKGDGYIFSQSIKKMSETDKEWILDSKDYVEVKNNSGELLYKTKSRIVTVTINYTKSDGTKDKINLKQKQIAAFNQELSVKQKYEIHKEADKAAKMVNSEIKRQEFGSAGKYISIDAVDEATGEVVGKSKISLNQVYIEENLKLAGYNMLVSSETDMTDSEIYGVYHNLWKIEETFRILKGQLEARPIYARKRDSIYGHFLICYIAITLIRILQYKVFKSQFSANEIIDFIRNFNCLYDGEHNINLLSQSHFVDAVVKHFKLPVDNYFLNQNLPDKLFTLSIK